MCDDKIFFKQLLSTVEFLTGQVSDIFNHVEVDLFSPSQVIHGGFQVTKKRLRRSNFEPLGWSNQAIEYKTTKAKTILNLNLFSYLTAITFYF